MGCGGFQDCSEAQGYQFNFAVGMRIAVPAMMFLLEIAQEILRNWNVEFKSLAAVTQVDIALIPRGAFPRFVTESFRRGSFQNREFPIEICLGNFS